MLIKLENHHWHFTADFRVHASKRFANFVLFVTDVELSKLALILFDYSIDILK